MPSENGRLFRSNAEVPALENRRASHVAADLFAEAAPLMSPLPQPWSGRTPRRAIRAAKASPNAHRCNLSWRNKYGWLQMADEAWRAARLIPTSGINGADEQERRATSALLAVISAVREFGRTLTQTCGAPGGTVETFIEVPFKLGDKQLFPDGLIP